MGHDPPQLAEGGEEKWRWSLWEKGWVSLNGSRDVAVLIRGFAENRTDGTARPLHGVFNFFYCVYSYEL